MPSYDLATIQDTVAENGIESFTMMALNGIVTMGMNVQEALLVIKTLSSKDFYKTMPAQKDPGMFQDVYEPSPQMVKRLISSSPLIRMDVLSFNSRKNDHD